MYKGFKRKIAILMLAISLPATSLLQVQNAEAATLSAAAKRDKVVRTAIALTNKVQYVHWTQRQERYAPYRTDCSGFTYLAYRLANVGVRLVNKDDDDQARVGTRVAWGNFKKGDLVFFWLDRSDKRNVGHVGIYIGNGKMIHNITAKKDVIISNIYTNSYYKERFVVARRVIN